MRRFYHIYIDSLQGMTHEEIEKKLDLAVDWFRYGTKNWIVYTTSDENKWYERLKSFVRQGGNLFICELDISTAQGWMSKEFWEWIEENEKRS